MRRRSTESLIDCTEIGQHPCGGGTFGFIIRGRVGTIDIRGRVGTDADIESRAGVSRV